MVEDQLESARAYRRALGCFPTGVAVVTADLAEGAAAITVNSFASLSLHPRLVSWALDENSDRYARFAGATHFGVNVLAASQEALSARFAQPGAGPAGPHEIEHWGLGAPLLKEALARFDCRTVGRRHVGDHLLIIGEVTAYQAQPGDALTYFRGRYGAAPAPEN